MDYAESWRTDCTYLLSLLFAKLSKIFIQDMEK